MTSITLYHSMFSTCSQKVRYLLAIKGLEYESRLVSLPEGEQLEDWYLAINPNGVVPSLVHNGEPIIDSSVICEYLDEVFPDIALTPSGPVARARMRAWMRYFEEVPTAAIRAPSFNALFARNIVGKGDAENRRRGERMPLRKHFYAKLGPQGFPREMVEESTEKLAACIARVDRTCRDRGPYLLGPQLTIADITLLPTIVRMEDIGMDQLWRDSPSVAHWFALMKSNPAFDRAYPSGSRFNRATRTATAP